MMKSDPKDLLENLNDKLNGIYRGVVEDNHSDPLKIGRCKIRVYGIHTPNKIKTSTDGIPTDELPWSEPCLSLFEGSVSGYGEWVVPLQGSHVFLFFENGHILKPRYFASAPGIPSDQNHGLDENQGFSDPDNRYPEKAKLKESDFHRLARNEKTGQTLLAVKNSNTESNVSTVDGSWSEPSSFYNATYPNNKVIASHSGIVIEIDDTPNNERIHIYHPSNSYIEIGPNGSIVIKTGEKFEIVNSNKNVLIKSNLNETVNENATLKIGTDYKKDIGGLDDTVIGGDKNEEVSGNKNSETTGTVLHTAGATMNLEATAILTLQGSAVVIKNAAGTTIMNLNSSGSSDITANELTINSTGGFVINDNVTINGNLQVNGNIGATGSNPNNHTHP